MELKVWVDGIQRVVCGITEQTTVQEVVIALAQATGRTGRYTLVERWKTMEKMLPPSERPLQVLADWGERGADVQFVLRRTGANGVVGASGDEGVVMPERTQYRQSLPPQLKHRQKNEAIMNRKEPKRKSLNLTGVPDPSSSKQKTQPDTRPEMEPSTNNATNARKQALLPPNYRNSTFISQTLETSNAESTGKVTSRFHSLNGSKSSSVSTKKKALMPPHMRKDSDSSLNANSGLKSITTVTSVPNISKQQIPTKTGSLSKLTDSAKARAEFTRLVFEQHEHVSEQILTLKSLDDEIMKAEESMQRKEKNSKLLKKDIENLEKKIKENEIDLNNEALLEGLVQDEERKGSDITRENSKFQSEISTVNVNISELEKHLSFLKEEIEKEVKQRIQEKEDTLTRSRTAQSKVKKVNAQLRNVVGELKSVDERINNLDQEMFEKALQMETLNRELRQVNLQQFIRQTGSKVTVLPPETDRGVTEDYYIPVDTTMQNNSSLSLATGSQNESGGVWV
ncbi:ras association domain-containing protein 8-like [Clavelina lepadiformis]